MDNRITKIIYELLEKVYSKDASDFSLEDFLKNDNNEIKGLIALLTNCNPFVSMRTANIAFERLENDNVDISGQYQPNEYLIRFSIPLIESILKNPKDIGLLLDTIYHEQRHNKQNYDYASQKEMENETNLKEIYMSCLDTTLQESDIEELNKFAQKHDLIKLKISKSKLQTLQFGAYLSNQAEIDAREYAYEQTIHTFDAMLSDENCPEKLKKELKKSLKVYKQKHDELEAENKSAMKSFEHLEKRVKDRLLKIIKSNEKIDEETYTQLLSGMMDFITRNNSLNENLEIAGWALKNGYTNLLYCINIKKSLSPQIQDLDKFIAKLSTQNVINSENFDAVSEMLCVFKQNNKDRALQHLVADQVEFGNPEILIDNILLRKNDEYISFRHVELAVSNHINKVFRFKSIENAERHALIQRKIHFLVHQTSILSEDEKQKLMDLHDKFKQAELQFPIRTTEKATSEDLNI